MKVKIDVSTERLIERGDIIKYDDATCIVTELPKINNPYPIIVIRLEDGKALFSFSDYEKLSRTALLIVKSVNSMMTISEVR